MSTKLTVWALKLTQNVDAVLDRLNVKSTGLANRFSTLQNKLGGITKGFGGLGAIAAGALASFSIGSFANASIQAFDSQAKSAAQLQAVLISTKGIAGKTFKELEDAASHFQKVTLFEDDQTMGAQSLLLTFTKVRGAIYDQAIPALLDFATAMKTTPEQAALQLGKALNDPVHGIAALRRAGVQFSEGQTAMIKKMIETNRIADAQKIILGELATQFGGSAEAAAKAGMGPITVMRHAFADQMERIGLMLSKIFQSLLPFIEKFIDKMGLAISWLEKNWGLIKDIFSSIYTGVATTLEIFGPLLVVIGLITAAQWAWNVAMTANPIGVVVMAVAALIAGIVLLWKRCEEFRGFLYGFWEAVKSIFTNIGNLIADVFGGWLDMITGIITFDFDQFKGGLLRIYDSVTGTAQKLGTDAATSFNKGFETGVKEVQIAKATGNNNNWNVLTGSAGPTPVGMPQTDAQLEKGTSSVTDGTKQVRNVTINIQKLVEKIENHFSSAKDISDGDMTRRVEEALIRIVNGAEVAISNG